ncbi:MAG: TrkH family potassium uptake protein [Miltoncostaeaceae bacterium]
MSSRPLARLRPAQSVALAFLAFIAGGTLLLMLPISTSAPESAAFGDAFFTATSAVTVTGLSVVDTASYWSGFGEAVILVLCQLGGLGVMTFTAILVLIISGRLGLRRRQAAQAEQGLIAPGEVRSILIGVAILTAIIESLVALVLFLRFLSLGEGFGRALWYGLFHSVTAFNNAGFALFQDNFMSFSDDWVILGALSVAIIAGGLGLPVWSEIIRRRRTHDRVHRFSLHTRLTLIGTGVLLVFGIGLVLLFEWSNPGTLGPMGVGDKILNGGFQGISPRTAGFNSVDYAQMKPESLMVTDFLMLIGAGSVSTSGGIKVTTMLVLAIATIASLRGDSEVQLLGRRLPGAAIRVALAVTVVFTSLIALGTLLMVSLTEFGLEQSLFEITSALSTTGLSTGITSSLPVAGDAILIVLMILGRLGPQVLGASLVLRERSASYHYPEERPIVG